MVFEKNDVFSKGGFNNELEPKPAPTGLLVKALPVVLLVLIVLAAAVWMHR